VTSSTQIASDFRAAIRTSTEAFSRLIVAQDFDGLIRLYTEDVVVMPPGHPALEGRAAVKSWLESFPKITRFDADLHEIDGEGDLAYARGSYMMTLLTDQGSVEVRGKYIEIHRRRADGSWPIMRDIFNADS
jgi:ketosteroid isomerase-like protein